MNVTVSCVEHVEEVAHVSLSDDDVILIVGGADVSQQQTIADGNRGV